MNDLDAMFSGKAYAKPLSPYTTVQVCFDMKRSDPKSMECEKEEDLKKLMNNPFQEGEEDSDEEDEEEGVTLSSSIEYHLANLGWDFGEKDESDTSTSPKQKQNTNNNQKVIGRISSADKKQETTTVTEVKTITRRHTISTTSVNVATRDSWRLQQRGMIQTQLKNPLPPVPRTTVSPRTTLPPTPVSAGARPPVRISPRSALPPTPVSPRVRPPIRVSPRSPLPPTPQAPQSTTAIQNEKAIAQSAPVLIAKRPPPPVPGQTKNINNGPTVPPRPTLPPSLASPKLQDVRQNGRNLYSSHPVFPTSSLQVAQNSTKLTQYIRPISPTNQQVSSQNSIQLTQEQNLMRPVSPTFDPSFPSTNANPALSSSPIFDANSTPVFDPAFPSKRQTSSSFFNPQFPDSYQSTGDDDFDPFG